MDNILLLSLISAIGAIGFSVLFNVRGRQLWWIAVGAALGWIVYSLVLHYNKTVFMAVFIATAFIVVLGEILARIIKVPIIMLIVPMLIPLIPGGTLYYTMYNLIIENNALFIENLRSLLVQAVAIAVGITVSTAVMGTFFRYYYKMLQKIKSK